MFALGEWNNCRGVALVVNSETSTLGFKRLSLLCVTPLIEGPFNMANFHLGLKRITKYNNYTT